MAGQVDVRHTYVEAVYIQELSGDATKIAFHYPGPKFTNIILRFIVRYVLRLS